MLTEADDLLRNPEDEGDRLLDGDRAPTGGGFRQALINLTPPTHCGICGRELTNARSKEIGIGPICAEELLGGQGEVPLFDAAQAAEVLRTCPEPMRTRVNQIGGGHGDDAPWRTSGEVRRKMIQSACWYASSAASYGSDPRDTVNEKADPALRTISAVENLCRAFGYQATADRMMRAWLGDLKREEKRQEEQKRLAAKEAKNRIRFKRGAGQFAGLIGVSAPYSVPFNDAARNARHIFVSFEKVGYGSNGEFWRYFRPDNIGPVCDILSACFGSTLAESPDGDLMAIPSMPLLLVPPPTPPAPPPTKVTNERVQKTPAALKPLNIGDEIVLPDGSKSIIQYLNPWRRSVGVGLQKGKGYTFISFDQIESVNGRAVFDKLQQARIEEAEQQDEPSPPPPVEKSNKRQIPAGFMPHQVEGVEFIDRVGRVLLADEMGLGKTAQAVVAIDVKAICVVPSHVKINWVREINMWRPELAVLMVVGTKPPEDAAIAAADVFVINYDILHYHMPWLLKVKAKTLIADEAHYLKNLRLAWNKQLRIFEPHKQSPRRAAAFYQLQLTIPRLIELTGTPIMNRTKELFPLLHMLDPETYASFFQFCMRYCGGHEEQIFIKGGGGATQSVLVCDGVSNAGELHERISGKLMLRRLKTMLKLPPKARRTQYVPLDEANAKIYARAANEFKKWVEENGGVKAVEAVKKAEALTRMTALRKLAAIGKVQAATQWIGEFLDSTSRPLVVMSWHNEVHQAIAAAVDEMNALVGTNEQVVYRKIRYGFVTGDQSFAQRQKTIDQFQAGELDLCIYGIPLATGTTLTRAQDVVFVERAWRPADLVQAEDRIHRIGQKNDCLVTYLDAVGTIDASIAALLADKVATAAGVIDGEDLSDADAASRVLGDLFKADDSAKPTKRTSRTKTTKNPARETVAYNWDEPLLP